MAFKTIQQAKENLQRAIPLISERYRQGVESADWQTNAASEQAEQNFAAGVQQAIANKSRQKGIQGVSNQQWREAARVKGANSIGQGIQMGLQRYEQNFAPVLGAMQAAAKALPPRTTDPIANVTARVIPVVQAAVNAGKR